MLSPGVVDRIRELAGQGVGSKSIARTLRISRNTVRRYLAGATAGSQRRPASRRLDDAALAEVHRLYRTVAEGNAVVIQQELAAAGIGVDLRAIQRAVAPLRRDDRAAALATVRFETDPGHQIQIDFGEKMIIIAGELTRVYFMTAVLGYSRRIYCRASLAQRQDDWLEGLEGAFAHFGGLVEQVLCDNASPLVTHHDRDTGEVAWNPGFESFCRDRGLTPRACRPRRARTKGKIERGVGYVKHNALAGRAFDSLADLQRHLSRWALEVADERVHGTTDERPRERFERDERAALRPLPPRPLAVRTRRLKRRVSADCFVDIDTVRYSVPHRHVREQVDVVITADAVEVHLRGRLIASHRRRDEPRSWVRDPAHFEGLYRPATTPPSGPPSAPAGPTMAGSIQRPLAAYAEVVEGGRP
ncbi:IS21 family transposase [Aquisphaera insulae]|uniref:IS21 family transposase n=1 Tax=Aquisphaera insulae TaxID=2712864 RepID=UPI0013E9E2F9|nr:IS21 family transposase [Aquisphaera insulae]